MICVIATIEVAEGRREEFLAEFRKIIPAVQAEQGCLEYTPMVDVPTHIGRQSPPRDNTVTVVEKWESVEALEKHLMAPHMVEYRKRIKPIVTSSSLAILRPV